MNDENIPHDDTEERKWLEATKQVFSDALKDNPPWIGRSQVESLIIGLRSNVVTPRGKEILKMLQSYADVMKAKHRPFLKVIGSEPKIDEGR